MFLGLKTEY